MSRTLTSKPGINIIIIVFARFVDHGYNLTNLTSVEVVSVSVVEEVKTVLPPANDNVLIIASSVSILFCALIALTCYMRLKINNKVVDIEAPQEVSIIPQLPTNKVLPELQVRQDRINTKRYSFSKTIRLQYISNRKIFKIMISVFNIAIMVTHYS